MTLNLLFCNRAETLPKADSVAGADKLGTVSRERTAFMTETANLPFVSALLVTRNEAAYIERAMMSLIEQSYPKDRYEIIVIDGMSDDGTVAKIEETAARYSTDTFNIRLLTNEKKILAAGWNLGIEAARGEYVVRIDAHAEAAPDFIERNVEVMSKVDAVCVGGKLTTCSLDGDEETVSKVLSSPFGVGNSSFRVSDTAGYADTAVYGLYKKSVFDQVGLFNENFVRNQDIELHSRIKRAGGKFYFDPSIKCLYYSRNTVKKMMKQAYGNGKWNMVLAKKEPSALSLRHLVPAAFVVYILLSAALGFLYAPIWFVLAGVILLHLILGFVAACAKKTNLKEKLTMPFLFLLLHLSYGTGYFAGLFTRVKN